MTTPITLARDDATGHVRLSPAQAAAPLTAIEAAQKLASMIEAGDITKADHADIAEGIRLLAQRLITTRDERDQYRLIAEASAAERERVAGVVVAAEAQRRQADECIAAHVIDPNANDQIAQVEYMRRCARTDDAVRVAEGQLAKLAGV